MSELTWVQPPKICQECGDALLDFIRRNTELETGSRYCPHHESALYGVIRDFGEGRTVARWIIQGPLSEEEALEIAAKLGKRSGWELVFPGTLQ